MSYSFRGRRETKERRQVTMWGRLFVQSITIDIRIAALFIFNKYGDDHNDDDRSAALKEK